MAIGRVTEIVGSSPKSFDDAISAAFKRASKTLRGMTGLEVGRQTIKIENNKAVEYRVHLNVTFVLED
ncbi:MAG: dodecin domain-containing protein [Planctomycetes bacterium]|nr:dodecin domain-containing protein [Planctomycetota bacterium]